MRILLVGIMFILSLVGCASSNSYVMPEPSQYGNQLVTIQGYRQSNGLFDWREAHVSSIDDKEVSYLQQDLIGGYKSSKKIFATPGQHTFVVATAFNRKFMGDGPFESYSDLSATLAPGKSYKLNMEVHGSKVKVWMTDQSGRAVSSMAENSYRRAPKNYPVYIPVNQH